MFKYLNIRSIGALLSVLAMLFSPFCAWGIKGQAGKEKNSYTDKAKEELKDIQVELYITSTGQKKILDFEEYICGVLLAEVPMSFEFEALKAMAVASRSYTYRRIKSDGKIEHYSADVCDNYAHCLGYISLEDAESMWGETQARGCYEKVKKAVMQTRGEVLYYGENIADTVFHASSYGYTENAKNVWGYDVPYLVSVQTSGEYGKNTVQFTCQEFASALMQSGIKIDTSQSGEKWIEKIQKNDSGRVETVRICGYDITGRRAREIFNLQSTGFDVSFDGDVFIFDVKGAGHGVGMSQYGCQQMALDGKNYKEILAHYYQNTILGLYA